MKLQLMVAQGVHKGKIIAIAGTQFVIGRDPACQLRPSSPAISKKHCAIIVRGESVYFQDFGSTNGSFVNGEKVTGETQVRDQDRLKAGPLEFVLVVQAATEVAAAKKPAGKVAAPAVQGAGSSSAEDDSMAALLLSDDSGPGGIGIPDGSTVMEMPAFVGDPNAPTEAKKETPKKATFTDSSSAAAEILRRYQKRPRS